MRRPVRKVLTGILALFLFPLAVHAALYASKDRPGSFRDADWSSVGMLPPAGVLVGCARGTYSAQRA